MSRSPRRWALLIGIDEYRFSPAWRLRGAVRDVEAVERHLRQRRGFPAENIRKLINRAASRQGILDGLAWLEARVGPDDLVVLHYSGHGSWRFDTAETKWRADGREKTLVPWDSGRGDDHPNLDLGGDELYALLGKLTRKTRFLTVILDCCHSGTLTRDDLDLRPRFVEPDTRGVVGASQGGGTASDWFPNEGRQTLLSACRSDQSALEIHDVDGEGGSRGLLTYHLLRHLESSPGRMSYQELVDAVREDIAAHLHRRVEERAPEGLELSQEPQLEGWRELEALGHEELPSLRYFKVLECSADGVVSLEGGNPQALRPGIELEVYPLGTRRAMPPGSQPPNGLAEGAASSLGRLRVDSVEGVRSTARVLHQSGERPIAPGDRAVVVSWSVVSVSSDSRRATRAPSGYGVESVDEGLQLPVFLAPCPGFEDELARMCERITASSLLRLARPRELPEVELRIGDPGQRAGESRRSGEEAGWELRNPEGRLLAPRQCVSEPGAATRVIENLEKRARARMLGRLEGPPGGLDGLIDFELLRPAADARWQGVPTDGEPVFELGERFAFRITNHAKQSVFVYLVDIGFGGGIGLLFPTREGAWEPLESDRSVEVGTVRETCRFHLPPGYPYQSEPPPWGREQEVFLLLATTESTDLRYFFQGSYRHWELPDTEPGSTTDLARTLGFLMLGRAWRSAGEPLPSSWSVRRFSLWIDVGSCYPGAPTGGGA